MSMMNGVEIIENNSFRPTKRYKRGSLSIDNLDFMSFVNLVNYYKDELILLMEKKDAKDIFTNNTRQMLNNHFVIVLLDNLVNVKNINNRFYYPSCLTRMVLSGLIEFDCDEL